MIITRLVRGKVNYHLYFSTENSKMYHGYQPQFIELNNEVRKTFLKDDMAFFLILSSISMQMIDAIKCLFNSYPYYKRIRDLPGNGNNIKVRYFW